ncbi:hypothetical protein ABIE62_000911 [Porphyrobacter sp. MBR-155]|jgi:hypothetical protein|uniref:hypothetical protein n=1 Tax=Porphyrobacter sp. MBR-155 TaxID=3156464 RepID=UPI003395E74A
MMDNHVHLILVPAREGSLRAALVVAYRRYTRMINFRDGWRGHLFQARLRTGRPLAAEEWIKRQEPAIWTCNGFAPVSCCEL